MITNKKTVQVWNPLIRIGHWTLVVAFFIAYFTDEDLIAFHAWAGYIVGVYVLIRMFWGLVGDKYACFSNFVYSPARVFGGLRDLITRTPQHYIGHNPAGGAMVVALLISLAGTAVSGMKLYAIEENKGPFSMSAKQVQSQLQAVSVIADAKAEDNDDGDEDEESKLSVNERELSDDGENYWEKLHEALANLTLWLVFLHIAGVIASSIVDKEKLVKAMLTGKKEIDDTYK
jgi:cytochrome b